MKTFSIRFLPTKRGLGFRNSNALCKCHCLELKAIWMQAGYGEQCGVTLSVLENWWVCGSPGMPSSNFIVHQTLSFSSSLKTSLKFPLKLSLKRSWQTTCCSGSPFAVTSSENIFFLIIVSLLWEQEMPVARATLCDASASVSVQTLCSVVKITYKS